MLGGRLLDMPDRLLDRLDTLLGRLLGRLLSPAEL